ncbi:ribonuclease HI family protein [Patescibacteria group bacterium]|nr:ribonuclease HI family protein [Patescibacteria group bacterium]MBU4078380.1 ribonuclease HI family protein [Patescibacteria group bacterium]
MSNSSDYIIYTDGASKGNPGPASIGVAIYNSAGVLLKEYSELIGETTNNVAEYQAVIFALKKLKALYGKKNAKESIILINSDSKLLVKQLNGEFRLKDEKIQKLFIEIWNEKMDFKQVLFKQIPREKNQLADSLANQAFGGGLL